MTAGTGTTFGGGSGGAGFLGNGYPNGSPAGTATGVFNNGGQGGLGGGGGGGASTSGTGGNGGSGAVLLYY